MTTMKKRLAALGLALAMTAGLCACSSDGGNSGEKGKAQPMNESEKALLDSLGSEGLEGYKFQVVDFSNDHWNREKSGTAYADAWQQAMDEVEQLYNCTISATMVSPSDLFNAVQPEVAADGKYADLIITTQWAYGYLMGAGIMQDLNRLSTASDPNYAINWDDPYWNQNIRTISTIRGKTYAGNSSFIFDTSQTYMLYYNEDIWNELGLPDPYELVRSGQWTQDKFAEYSRRAMKDQDGSGRVDSLDDRWGVATPAGDFTRAQFMGMGGHYYLTNSETGMVELACNNARTYSIVEKMYNMGRRDQSVCTITGAEWNKVVTLFTDGNALFLGNSPGVQELKNMDTNWGVMPMPKLDESQESYYGSVDHNSSVFGITNTNRNLKEVSYILNALGLHCQTLESIYWPDYETTYWRHPEDAQIIADYVVRTGQYDIAVLMQNANKTLPAPMARVHQSAYGSAGPDFASYIDQVQEVLEAELESVFAPEE